MLELVPVYLALSAGRFASPARGISGAPSPAWDPGHRSARPLRQFLGPAVRKSHLCAPPHLLGALGADS